MKVAKCEVVCRVATTDHLVLQQSCVEYLFCGCVLYSSVFVWSCMNQNKFICLSEVKCLFDLNFSLFKHSYPGCNGITRDLNVSAF